MALMDLNDVVSDADIAEPFVILRSTGAFVAGGYQSAPASIPSFGVISQPNGIELEQVPEGDRAKGAIVVHTQAPIYQTNPTGTSDIVVWYGDQYRVVKVYQYQNRNYYHAIAVRMSGQ